MKKFKLASGFTLVELLVVMTVVAILSTAGLVSLRNVQRAARDSRRVSDVRSLQAPLELYYNDQPVSAYPSSLTALVPQYIPQVPTEPPPYSLIGYTTCNTGQNYVIGIQLEGQNAALVNDIDDPQRPTGCTTVPCGTATAESGTGPYYFCLTN